MGNEIEKTILIKSKTKDKIVKNCFKWHNKKKKMKNFNYKTKRAKRKQKIFYKNRKHILRGQKKDLIFQPVCRREFSSVSDIYL